MTKRCETCSYEHAGWCFRLRTGVDFEDLCGDWTDGPITIPIDPVLGETSLCDLAELLMRSLRESLVKRDGLYAERITQMRHLLNDAEVRLVTGWESHDEGELEDYEEEKRNERLDI